MGISKEEYEELYNKVFTHDNQIKVCGRANTSKLIKASKYMDVERNFKSFGDEMTGVMNVKNIIALHTQIVGY